MEHFLRRPILYHLRSDNRFNHLLLCVFLLAARNAADCFALGDWIRPCRLSPPVPLTIYHFLQNVRVC